MSRKKLNRFNNFSKRLNQLLKKTLKITQKEFCDKVGISEAYLSMILNKKVGPSAELIAGIFLNYNEYLHCLLTGEDNSKEIKIAEKEIPYGGNEERIASLLKIAAGVLTSNTKYAQSLEHNITLFHESITNAGNLEARLAALEQKQPCSSRKNSPRETAKNVRAGDATKKMETQ